MTQDNKVCIARIGAARGVRGEVRLFAFTEDPLKASAYGPLETADGGKRLRIARLRAAKDGLVATIDGITTRDQAEELNGLELFVPRDRLPATADGEFYHADLIGLAAMTAEQRPLGTIVAVHNFGAGDLLEIRPENDADTVMVPFNSSVVPLVDIVAGRIVIDPPHGLFKA